MVCGLWFLVFLFGNPDIIRLPEVQRQQKTINQKQETALITKDCQLALTVLVVVKQVF
jgi:hypothetical protein